MKKLFIPKYIYKYTRFNEYWEDIFQNRRFYMPSPDELNDPFEGQLLPVGSGTVSRITSFTFCARTSFTLYASTSFTNFFLLKL